MSDSRQIKVVSAPAPITVRPSRQARLRQRLFNSEPEDLADEELLEMTLSLAIPKGESRALAEDLLDRFGSFAAVISAPATQLGRNYAMGDVSAALLKIVHIASLRLARAELSCQPVLSGGVKLMTYLTVAMAREKREQFRVLFMDNRSRLLADEILSRGTIDHTPVYLREVFRRAIEIQCAALILVHNHPAGDPKPSLEDIAMTRNIIDAAKLIGIAVWDHVIVGNGTCFSFKNEGFM
jgi:DNA repair protein RadC